MCQRKNAREYWWSMGQRRCHCGRQLVWSGLGKNRATIEHIIPKSKGGTLALKNTLIVCRDCNQKRGTKDFTCWTAGSRFPKKEWLHKKHKEAIAYYEDSTSRHRDH